MFATLNKIKDEKTGKMRERDKPETEEVAFRHKSLMQSGHLDATPYVIDPNKILWTVHDGSKGFEVKNFLMLQEEGEEFGWDQQKETKASWRSKNPELEARERDGQGRLSRLRWGGKARMYVFMQAKLAADKALRVDASMQGDSPTVVALIVKILAGDGRGRIR